VLLPEHGPGIGVHIVEDRVARATLRHLEVRPS
jgi:hypothetical protein